MAKKSGPVGRDPGEKIKLLLRKEVNFGCPVKFSDGSGCGSPILTYHHFDPPWAGNFVHNPDGMIALCPAHHNQADGGGWTTNQLKEMKKNPFVDDVIKVQWPWQTEKLVMKVGNSLIIEKGSAIRISGRQVMGFFPAKIDNFGIDTITFNAEVPDRYGTLWFKIERSFLNLEVPSTSDLLFTPQLKQFYAANKDGTFLKCTFKKIGIKKSPDWLKTFIADTGVCNDALKIIQEKGCVDSSDEIPVMDIEGHFSNREVEVKIGENKFDFTSKIPGMEENFLWKTHIASGGHRILLRKKGGPEFFGLG